MVCDEAESREGHAQSEYGGLDEQTGIAEPLSHVADGVWSSKSTPSIFAAKSGRPSVSQIIGEFSELSLARAQLNSGEDQN
jgi:hypothetical protein